jgi:hypothetical protein
VERILTGLKNGAPEECGGNRAGPAMQMLCRSREADYADSESLQERAALSAGCGDD